MTSRDRQLPVAGVGMPPARRSLQVRELQTTFVNEHTHLQDFEMPQLLSAVTAFMGEPDLLLELSLPAVSMSVVTDQTEDLREWLFTQAVGISSRTAGSDIAMIYAGMSDGRFIGYYHDQDSAPTRYTFRAAGVSAASSPDLEFTPYAGADTVPHGLSMQRPACDLDESTDASAVCPLGCDGSTCTGTAATRYALSAACPCATNGGCPSSDHCTATNVDGTAGCCHSNIRTFHTTTVEDRGVPQSLYGWNSYDPRGRAWYVEEIARPGKSGWSSVYAFTSGELGITRTAKMQRDASSGADSVGVLGVDFELSSISRILNVTLAGTDHTWAFMVERSGGAAGLLLGSSFGATLRSASGQRCYAHDSNCSTQAQTIISAACRLRDEGWRETAPGEVLTNTFPGNLTQGARFEAVSKRFTSGGLDWLIVLGQDILCKPNERWIFGSCEDCPPGLVPSDSRRCHACYDTYPGTVSDEHVSYHALGTRCVCPSGSYSVGEDDPPTCRPCSELGSRIEGVRDRFDEPILWEAAAVCPGGIPVQTESSDLPRGRVCPLPKIWISKTIPGQSADWNGRDMVLLACPACVAGPCTNMSSAQQNSKCKHHHTGFLCASCEPGYEVVDGDCIECIRTDWIWISTEAVVASLIGIFLLSKTWDCVPDPGDAEAAFQIVDTNGDGYLSGVKLRTLLIQMGNPVAAGVSLASTMADMKAMDITAGYPWWCVWLRTKLPRYCGGSDAPDTDWVYTYSVSKHEFVEWCEINQPTGVLGIYIFALQTFALIMYQSSSITRPLEVFNLDIGKAAETCRLPSCGLFCSMMGLGVIPIVSGLSIYFGLWFMSTQVGTNVVCTDIEDNGLNAAGNEQSEQTRGLPFRWHHLHRGAVQLFLFTFAPVTRRCAELLLCWTVPGPSVSGMQEGYTTTRLVSNLSVECWSGSHMVAAIIAVGLLIIYTVFIPVYLLYKTRQYIEGHDKRKLNASLSKQRTKKQGCSGKRIICLNPYIFLAARRSTGQFNPRMREIPALNPQCWDELLKAHKPTTFAWFMFMLVLKLVINLIFLLGKSYEFNWGMYLQITMVLAALLAFQCSPYKLAADNRQEQMSFLGLSVVLSITSSGVPYADGWTYAHVALVMFAVALPTFSLIRTHLDIEYERRGREKRVADGRKDLEQYAREVLALYTPTYLLLSKESREQIHALIQVETFKEGIEVYKEGDLASAFFVVRSGTITLSTSDETQGDMVIGEGQSFGASALNVSAGQRRVATATASSPLVVCLRLIRDDWNQVWSPITQEVATSLFAKSDANQTGEIRRSELAKHLRERWEDRKLLSRTISALVDASADALMAVLDINGDGKITLDEFTENLRKVPKDDFNTTRSTLRSDTSANSVIVTRDAQSARRSVEQTVEEYRPEILPGGIKTRSGSQEPSRRRLPSFGLATNLVQRKP